jgi:hypothetical protein
LVVFFLVVSCCACIGTAQTANITPKTAQLAIL